MAENNDELQQGKINNENKLEKGNVVDDDDDDDDFFNSLPVGYRFDPQDEELIYHYLMKKIRNKPLPRNRIRVVNLYERSPRELTEMHKLNKDIETEWYFFTNRNKKYPNGKRPDRKAGDGYWKPTGTDKAIPNKEKPLGFRKSLDYYEGYQSKGTKTEWKMHEYVVPSTTSNRNGKDNMQLDGWVLCKIYKNKAENKKNENNYEDGETSNSNTNGVPIANNFTTQLPNNFVQPKNLIINSTIPQDNHSGLISPPLISCQPLQSLPPVPPLLSLPPFLPLPSSPLPPLPPTLDNFDYDHMPIQSYESSSYPFQFMHGCDDHGCYGSCMAMDTKNYEVIVPKQPAIPLLVQNSKEETSSELVNHGATNVQSTTSHLQDQEENDPVFQNLDDPVFQNLDSFFSSK